ncbi:MAG: DUF4114 domain-containing protein [Alkalinema sp. RU_4_3]|nr:DUF4114 domain-containing protein [Alkalinema sp. RU_4_3]
MLDNPYPRQDEEQAVLIHFSLIKPYAGSIGDQEVAWAYVEDLLKQLSRGVRLFCSEHYLKHFLVEVIGVDPQDLDPWLQEWVDMGVELLPDRDFSFFRIISNNQEWDDHLWDPYFANLCLSKGWMLMTIDNPAVFRQQGISVVTPNCFRLEIIRGQLEKLLCLEFVGENCDAGEPQAIRYRWLIWIAALLLLLMRLGVRQGETLETVVGSESSSDLEPNVSTGAEDRPAIGNSPAQPNGGNDEEPPSASKMVRPRRPAPGSPPSGMKDAVVACTENSCPGDPGQENLDQEDDLASIAAATAIRNLITELLYRTGQQIFVEENLRNIALQAVVWSLILEAKRALAGSVFGSSPQSDSSRLESKTTVDRHDTRSLHYVAPSADGDVGSRPLQNDASYTFKFIGSEKRLEPSKLNELHRQVELEREVLVTQVVAADTRPIVNDPSKQLVLEDQIDRLDRLPLTGDVPILPKAPDSPSDSTGVTTNNPTNDAPSLPPSNPPLSPQPEIEPLEILRPRVWSAFNGVYTVDAGGQISIDYLIDGGFNEDSVGIFDLSQMDLLLFDPQAFAQEAIRRVLSNSSLGHVILSDQTEGAKFSGKLLYEDTDHNHGPYAGIKTFEMNPGSQFGIIMIPQGSFQLGLNQPDPQGPIFSLVNPAGNSPFSNVQMVSLSGDLTVVGIEDSLRADNLDKDYNDVVIQLKGATGYLPIQNLQENDRKFLPVSENIDRKGSESPIIQPSQGIAKLANDMVIKSLNPVNEDPSVQSLEFQRTRVWSEFDGVYTVGASGQISIDYLVDGGFYEGSVGIFDLSQMDSLLTDSRAFAQEAIRRVLSNSSLGHVVLSDQTEGAKFSGKLLNEDADHNHGRYAGVKTFEMNPGSQFGLIMIPQGLFSLGSNQLDPQRPIFSLVNASGNSLFRNVQMISSPEDSSVIAIEDIPLDENSDKDYNDIIIRLEGAKGHLPTQGLQASPDSIDCKGSTKWLNNEDPFKRPALKTTELPPNQLLTSPHENLELR